MMELLPIVSAGGQRQVRQALVPPVVYLDTWALRWFAENDVFGGRFRAALLRHRGTLALSDINLIEFTSFELPHHTEAAGRFVDSLFPHIFLMKGDPGKVIEREMEFLAGRLDQSPAGDEKALAQFAQVVARRGGRSSMAVWFNIVYSERERLKGQLQRIADVFYEQLSRLRKRQEQQPRSLDPVANLEHTSHGRPATQQLMRAIVRDMQTDHQLPEDPNSAIDLLHAIVPGAYCDFVLLDRQWAARLERAAARLREASIPIRLRATYSKRDGGIEKFLQALEAWSRQT